MEWKGEGVVKKNYSTHALLKREETPTLGFLLMINVEMWNVCAKQVMYRHAESIMLYLKENTKLSKK